MRASSSAAPAREHCARQRRPAVGGQALALRQQRPASRGIRRAPRSTQRGDVGRPHRFGIEGRRRRCAAPARRAVRRRAAPAPACARPSPATASRRVGAPARTAISSRRCQLVDGVGPGVALVGDLRLQQRQRPDARRRLPRYSTLPATGTQCVKLDHVGQEAAHLEFRVDARLQAAVGLEEQALAEQADRVAARRSGGATASARPSSARRPPRQRPCRGVKRRLPPSALAARAGADGVDDGAAEGLVGHRVGDHAHRRPAGAPWSRPAAASARVRSSSWSSQASASGRK